MRWYLWLYVGLTLTALLWFLAESLYFQWILQHPEAWDGPLFDSTGTEKLSGGGKDPAVSSDEALPSLEQE